MSTKNPNQRYHFVLAGSAAQAKPILDQLRANGLATYRTFYLTTPSALQNIAPEQCAFIYGPGSDDANNARIRERVTDFIERGAVVKADPVAEARKREEARKAEEMRLAAQESLRSATALQREVERLQNMAPVGGMWDQLKGPTAPVSQNLAVTEQTYKQVYLGGPRHGQRVREAIQPSQHEIVFHQLPEFSARDFVTKGTVPSLPEIRTVTYRRAEFNVFGAHVTVWVHDREWSERNKLVRDFLLFSLEV